MVFGTLDMEIIYTNITSPNWSGIHFPDYLERVEDAVT